MLFRSGLGPTEDINGSACFHKAVGCEESELTSPLDDIGHAARLGENLESVELDDQSSKRMSERVVEVPRDTRALLKGSRTFSLAFHGEVLRR